MFEHFIVLWKQINIIHIIHYVRSRMTVEWQYCYVAKANGAPKSRLVLIFSIELLLFIP